MSSDSGKGTPPARLFVILAAQAHVGVVVRRGPTAWSQITRWDVARDELTEGAWFRGRIYAEKCDLSPDGELFVHAVFQGSAVGPDYTHAWTAVSRPPWLHALALWPMGTTYGGGGRFVGPRRLVLRGAGAAHPDHPPRGLQIEEGNPEVHRSTGEVEGASWCGRDQRGRLVFAKDRRLFARVGARDVELADFNGQRPHPAPPPDWATRSIAPRTAS